MVWKCAKFCVAVCGGPTVAQAVCRCVSRVAVDSVVSHGTGKYRESMGDRQIEIDM